MVEPPLKISRTDNFMKDISLQSCWLLLASFVLVINKYILTSLGFQFPTLFLGWQTLAQLLILKLDAVVFRSSKTNLTSKWKQVVLFSPAIFLHIVSLYAGSISLSRLHLFIYLPLQNFRLVLREIFLISASVVERLYHNNGNFIGIKSSSGVATNFAPSRALPKFSTGLLLVFLALSGYAIRIHDVGFSSSAYRWLALHCVAAAAADFHAAIARGIDLDLTPGERAVAKNAGSFLVFLLGAVLTGEWRLSLHFPHWRLYRFYIATFASGCLGGARGIFAFRLRRRMVEEAKTSTTTNTDSTSSSSSTNAALTAEWNGMVGELGVLAKAIIASISFVYFSHFFYSDEISYDDDVSARILYFALISFFCEFLLYRMESSLPSISLHFFVTCFSFFCRRKKPIVILA